MNRKTHLLKLAPNLVCKESMFVMHTREKTERVMNWKQAAKPFQFESSSKHLVPDHSEQQAFELCLKERNSYNHGAMMSQLKVQWNVLCKNLVTTAAS